ncbi:MAG: hypothetical protein ABSA59_03755 [Terriglobia bacterium]
MSEIAPARQPATRAMMLNWYGRATVAACPIQIDDAWLPLEYQAREKPTVSTALTVVACCWRNRHEQIEGC